MPNQPKEVLMDQQHYDRILKEIEELRQRRDNINLGRNHAFNASAGEGRNAPEFEGIEQEVHLIDSQIRTLVDMLASAVIVERQENNDLVDLEDVLKLFIDYGDEQEECDCRLTSGGTAAIAGITDISLNSPLGEAIYQKPIGAERNFKVNGNTFRVQILAKLPKNQVGMTL